MNSDARFEIALFLQRFDDLLEDAFLTDGPPGQSELRDVRV